MIDLILIAAGAVTLLVLLLLAKPVARCLRCRGRRMVRIPGTSRKRLCGHCKGRGIAVMPGATLVHSFFWSVFGDRILGQRRAAVAEQVAARKESA